MKRVGLLGVLMLLLLAAGCQVQNEESVETENVLEQTASVANLPGFLEYYPDNIVELYKGIPDFQEVLEQLPSYASNGEPGEFDNLYKAFIYEETEDGEVTWNDHGARCNACIDSAAYSIEAYETGKSIDEIKEKVITQYGEGKFEAATGE